MAVLVNAFLKFPHLIKCHNGCSVAGAQVRRCHYKDVIAEIIPVLNDSMNLNNFRVPVLGTSRYYKTTNHRLQ